MKFGTLKLSACLAAVAIAWINPMSACGQEKAAEEKVAQDEVTKLELADGNYVIHVPSDWKKVEAKSTMIEAEYKIPMSDGDASERDGRLTIMPAGGSIDANVERWKGQFSQPGGGSNDDATKVEEIDVNGMNTHMVTISGTYAERAKMTDPPSMRENYRMLAAIIETGDRQYFIKFYGGVATVEANTERFEAFIKSFNKSE